jgi:Pyridoxamine 5'-phosphate oxidase
MARWSDILREVPDLAERARAVFDAHKHKTLATLRADGSPRISGIEADFWNDDLWLGSMPDSRKSADLKRDPRFAIHSATIDVELALGDAKLAGRAEPVSGDAFEAYVAHLHQTADEVPEGVFDLFRADVSEVVVIGIGDPPDHLVIETWREGRNGLRRIERR